MATNPTRTKNSFLLFLNNAYMNMMKTGSQTKIWEIIQKNKSEPAVCESPMFKRVITSLSYVWRISVMLIFVIIF